MTDDQQRVPPVTVPLRYLHAFLGGRVSFLDFCRTFEWVDSEAQAQGVNPFFRHERDDLQIASIEIKDDDSDLPLAVFRFQPDSRR